MVPTYFHACQHLLISSLFILPFLVDIYNGISLRLWFAFLWQLMTLTIFSSDCGPNAHLLWRNVFSHQVIILLLNVSFIKCAIFLCFLPFCWGLSSLSWTTKGIIFFWSMKKFNFDENIWLDNLKFLLISFDDICKKQLSKTWRLLLFF